MDISVVLDMRRWLNVAALYLRIFILVCFYTSVRILYLKCSDQNFKFHFHSPGFWNISICIRLGLMFNKFDVSYASFL